MTSASKACAGCGAEKSAADYYRFKSGRLYPKCKPCVLEDRRNYRAENSARIAAEQKARYAETRESVLQKQAEYRRRNAETIRARDRARYKLRAARCCQYTKDAFKRRMEADPEGERKKSRERAAKRRANNPAVKLRDRVTQRIRKGLGVGLTDCVKVGGLSIDMQELRVHLERQFTKGMSWENMGEWHIDHIVPLSSFDITGPDSPEMRRAWALTNLRPLWAEENLRKGAKVVSLL